MPVARDQADGPSRRRCQVGPLAEQFVQMELRFLAGATQLGQCWQVAFLGLLMEEAAAIVHAGLGLRDLPLEQGDATLLLARLLVGRDPPVRGGFGAGFRFAEDGRRRLMGCDQFGVRAFEEMQSVVAGE